METTDRPPAVTARDLGKTYRVYDSPWDRVLEGLVRRPRHRDFVAVEGVSFELPQGQGLGVVGQNGAGKSTLLKMLAGIVAPSRGSLQVRGKVASILELGSGFHPEFTGRQNIVLNAAMLGLTEEEVREKTPEIVAFSELGDFIDQPVKTYSTGMTMRLGFAIATQVEPEVLIIDEALSVGDGYFQKKCMDRLQRFLGDGGTLLFCSHAMYYVSAFCQRALWLRRGRVEALGATDEVVREYETFLQRKAVPREEAAPAPPPEEEVARRPVRITGVRLDGRSGEPEGAPHRLASGTSLSVEIAWETVEPALELHFGVGINRADGVEVVAFSSRHDGLRPWSGRPVGCARLVIPELPLVKGEFTLYVFVLDESGLHVHDQRILQRAFQVEATGYHFGIVRIPHTWESRDAREEAAGLGAGTASRR